MNNFTSHGFKSGVTYCQRLNESKGIQNKIQKSEFDFSSIFCNFYADTIAKYRSQATDKRQPKNNMKSNKTSTKLVIEYSKRVDRCDMKFNIVVSLSMFHRDRLDLRTVS